MNSLILKKIPKIYYGIQTMFLISVLTLPNHQQLAEHICFCTISILLLDMILMSEKMTSQTITEEFILK
jgi:hypothetical protein